MPDLIPRAKSLGVIVVENPTHFAFGELFVRRYGPERAAVMLPLRSLMDAGIPRVIATDGVVGIPGSAAGSAEDRIRSDDCGR